MSMFSKIKSFITGESPLPSGFSRTAGRRNVDMTTSEMYAALNSDEVRCDDKELRSAIYKLLKYYDKYRLSSKYSNLKAIVLATSIVTTTYDDDMFEEHCITGFDMTYDQRSKILEAYNKYAATDAEIEQASAEERAKQLNDRFNNL